MNQPKESTENRKFTRIPFDSGVRIVSTEGSWDSALIDISLRGVLITTPEKWRANTGDQFQIELKLENSEIQIRMEASVAHMEKNHVGFRLEHIDLDSITHLRRLVELNLGDTEILNRELSSLGQ